MAPQFTATNAPPLPDQVWILRAKTSLPVPVSPRKRTGTRLVATAMPRTTTSLNWCERVASPAGLPGNSSPTRFAGPDTLKSVRNLKNVRPQVTARPPHLKRSYRREREVTAGVFCFTELVWRAALSDLREAAVDEELDAGHVAALVRSEERDDLGDLVGGARAAGGDLRQHALDEFVHLLLVELESDRVSGRGDDAGADRVDADAPRAQVV